MRRMLVVLCLLGLGGCAMIGGPVTGQLEDGSETFQGTITGKIGQSTLTIDTSTGATCQGAFVQYPASQGYANVRGTMSCSDGRSGTFHIVKGTFEDAIATGDLGGKPITMKLGPAV
jgi:hypothetical protein